MARWPEVRCCLLPPLSSGGALVTGPSLRFHIPLIEPDVRISRIRLSDKTSRLHPRHAAPTVGQTDEPWVKAHGGLRPAARHLKIKPSYLGSLLDSTRNNPGDWYLRKLGLRRVTYIEEI